MQPYEQRLSELATKMAKAEYEEQFPGSKFFTWDNCTLSIKNERIASRIIPARIALQFGAECYEAGDENGSDFKDMETGLISHGLKPKN